MKTPLLLALALLSTLQSCFLGRTALNEPLDHEMVNSIQPGTTATEVVAKMGAPDEVVQLGRRTAYRYSYSIDKSTGSYFILLALFNEDTRSDRVWFFFDENQTLTHSGSTFNSHRAQFVMFPGSNIHDPEAARAANAERGIK